MSGISDNLHDELLIQLNNKTKEICRGDYSGVEELYPFINPEHQRADLSELTENFVLMATKLEGREYDLSLKIDELNEKNQALLENVRQRTEGSVVFFALITILSMFTFVIEILRVVNPGGGLVKILVSRGIDLFFVLTSLYFVFFTKMPLRKFGLNLDKWKKSLVESITVSVGLILAMLAYKYVAVQQGWMDGSNGLVNFKILDWTFILYLLIAPLQEFMARGVCLTSIERNITGKFAVPAVIILSALMFSLPHMTHSLSFATWTLGGGVIWGILYMRHRTILGVSISHYICGTMAFLCGFIG